MNYLHFIFGFILGGFFVGILYTVKKIYETSWLPDETTYDN